MYTQCSKCQTILRITAKTLGAAFGQVRCVHCGSVFNALDAIADELREDGRFPPQFHSERPPTLPDASAKPESDDDEGDSAPPVADSINQPAQSKRVFGAGSRWWYAGTSLLLVVLGLQLFVGERDYLLSNPRTRPLVERYCEWVSCDIELPVDLTQITLVNRDIRPHPAVDQALLITATVQNRAAFAQAYPQIRITLSDLNNRVVAERFFAPVEYLQSGTSTDDGLAPSVLLPVEFEVVDPGRQAVAFEFSFH